MVLEERLAECLLDLAFAGVGVLPPIESKRNIELDLSFLNSDTTYQATTFRDADGEELEISRLDVTAKTTMKESLRANGGVAIVLRPSESRSVDASR